MNILRNIRCRLAVATWLIWVSVLAFSCTSSSNNDGYCGISETYPTGSSMISADGLVAAFDMETQTPDGLLYDFSGNRHHSLITGTTDSEGIYGRALRFKTAMDRVDMPETYLFDLDGPLSVALWVRVDRLNIHQHIIAVDDKFVIWINTENKIRFTDTTGNGIQSKEAIEAGVWFSLAAVMAGSYGSLLSSETIRLYLDGDMVPVDLCARLAGDEPRWEPGPLWPSDAAYIGFESHQGDPKHQELQFEGVVDELLIFSRALARREVSAHANRFD
jgi:hypothetical protein